MTNLPNLIERLEAASGPDRELDEIERLLAAATPGRWCLQTGALGVNPWISGPNWTRPDGSYVRGGCILNMVAHDEREHDAALIVAARNYLPAMLTEIRELRAENARLNTDLRRCFGGETHTVRNERVMQKIHDYTENALAHAALGSAEG